MADTIATITVENNISFKRLEDGRTEICLVTDKAFGRNQYALRDALNGAGDKLTVKVNKYRKRRSLDANDYCWVLCQKLAEVLSLSGKINLTKEEVYRKHIREVGQFVDIPLKAEAVEDYKRHWEAKGDGWICEVLADSKLPGYKKVRTYFGSSSYDTREMSVLINSIVDDCKEQGIETMTPDELKSMVEAWK